MRILIIEDDTFKLDRICASLAQLSHLIEVTTATSVHIAVTTLSTTEFDLILLDMALPSHDLKPGGAPSSSLLSGGLEVLMELSFMKRQDRVIVVTQYPEIEIEGELIAIEKAESILKKICQINLAGVVQYDNETSAWESELLALVGD